MIFSESLIASSLTDSILPLVPYKEYHIEFLDKLPLTKADKVNYALLEEMAKEEAEHKTKKRKLNSF